MKNTASKGTVLFLCTGNYYRSRFAEIYFNFLCREKGIHWTADSRALAIHLGAGNVGPISPHVLERIVRHGILTITLRCPLMATESDLQAASKIIALDKKEHRPYILRNFPHWDQLLEYWNIPDLGEMSSGEAMEMLERELNQLVASL